MRETLLISGREVLVNFEKSKKSARIRMRIKPDLSLLVTYPFYVAKPFAFEFVKNQSDWIIRNLEKIEATVKHVIPDDPRRYKDYKEKARQKVLDRLDFFNQYYQFDISGVSIRNQQSRWGSCSSKGNLQFNYRIYFLDLDEIDYIVVHELCHLKEMNHSARFWSLVEEQIPNYKAVRKKLKQKTILSV